MTAKPQVSQWTTGNDGDHAAPAVYSWWIASHDGDDTHQGCLGTPVHAVHAIAPVCTAPPGTLLNLRTIAGRGCSREDLPHDRPV